MIVHTDETMPWGTWKPSFVDHVERVVGTSMDTVVVATDAGNGYLKALGNRQGEHALACEVIGSSMAEWIGLPTLEFALVNIDPGRDDVFLDAAPVGDAELVPPEKRRRAQAGPAFITKAVDARTWRGDGPQLTKLANPEAIAGLVLLDTWVGNPDRQPRRPQDLAVSNWKDPNKDNVMLVREGRRLRIVAMDFSVCLSAVAAGFALRTTTAAFATRASSDCSRSSSPS
jgi:hypothetical protein